MNTVDVLITVYLVLGVVTAFINGAVRKLEADALLGLVWVVCWWMTPLALLVTLVIHTYRALKAYQPLRRTKIYFLRNF